MSEIKKYGFSKPGIKKKSKAAKLPKVPEAIGM